MAHCLQASCEDSIADTYVAVVGYAHVHGIAEKFQRPILPICKPLKVLSVYNETGEAKYPVLKIDRTNLDIPTVQTSLICHKRIFASNPYVCVCIFTILL